MNNKYEQDVYDFYHGKLFHMMVHSVSPPETRNERRGARMDCEILETGVRFEIEMDED